MTEWVREFLHVSRRGSIAKTIGAKKIRLSRETKNSLFKLTNRFVREFHFELRTRALIRDMLYERLFTLLFTPMHLSKRS